MPEQEASAGPHWGHRGTRAIQRMVEFAPATGGLALWVHHHDVAGDVDVKADDKAAPINTDGHTVFYGAAFDKLPLAEQVGWVAHEVLHIALRHAQRYLELQQTVGDVDLQLFNTCADAVVNSTLGHLGWLQLPAGAVRLEKLLASALGREQGVESALLEWDVESLYRAIDDRRPPQGGRKAAAHGQGDGPKASTARALGAAQATDLKPGAGVAVAPEAEAEQTREWAERVLRAHAGDGAFSMMRVLMADLPHTRTPWEQVLRTQLAHALSRRRGLSWSRPSRSYIANQGRAGAGRRMPWEPGFTTAHAVPQLVVIVDVSGSIEDALMERFAREIDTLTRRLEAGLVLVLGDDTVRHVQRCEPGASGLRDIQFKGGGGTDFTPLLEEADRHRPDITVVLTDLDGPARWRPRWPVIWAVTAAHAAAAVPFGRKLVLV